VANKGKAKDRIFFSVVDRFQLIELLEVEDPRECKSFPVKTGFTSIQFSSRQVLLYLSSIGTLKIILEIA
jgi:hypothetical protein